jgi:hypothetical protein
LRREEQSLNRNFSVQERQDWNDIRRGLPLSTIEAWKQIHRLQRVALHHEETSGIEAQGVETTLAHLPSGHPLSLQMNRKHMPNLLVAGEGVDHALPKTEQSMADNLEAN